MIQKSMPSGYAPTGAQRFYFPTSAERVCAEIILKQKPEKRDGDYIRPHLALADDLPFRAAFRSYLFAF
jgi:hypothetical protein